MNPFHDTIKFYNFKSVKTTE